MPTPIHELPDHYTQDYRLSVLDVKQVTLLNLVGIGLLVPFYTLSVVWIALVREWRGTYTVEHQIHGLILIVAVFAVLLFHEWCHGVAIRWAGHRPRYGMKGIKAGPITIPVVLFATADNAYFRRTEFLVIALAPVVVITALCLLGITVLPDYLSGYFGLAMIINGSGAAGDLWMSVVVARYPEANTLIRDEEDSISVFTAS